MKRFAAALCLLVLACCVAVLASQVIATDNFARANQNPLAGNWSTISGQSPLQLISSTVEGTAVGSNSFASWNGGVFPASQYSEITLSANAVSFLFVRGNPGTGSTGYAAAFINNVSFPFGTSGVVELTGGFSASPVATLSAGVPVRMSIQNDTFGVTINGGVPIVLNQDTGIVGGVPGIGITPQAALNDTVITSWTGGTEGDPRYILGTAFGFGADAPLSSVNGNYPISTIPGYLLVCITGANSGLVNPVVTSSQDGTWNMVTTTASAVFNANLFWVVAHGGVGLDNVVFSQTGVSHMVVTCSEYAFTNAAVDQQTATTATSDQPSATVTTTQPNELLIGSLGAVNDPPTLGFGGAAYRFAALNELRLFDMMGVSAGSNTLAAKMGNPGNGLPQAQLWQEILVSFTGQTPIGGSRVLGPTRRAGPTKQF